MEGEDYKTIDIFCIDTTAGGKCLNKRFILPQFHQQITRLHYQHPVIPKQ